jgi:hypothetical protein
MENGEDGTLKKYSFVLQNYLYFQTSEECEKQEKLGKTYA